MKQRIKSLLRNRLLRTLVSFVYNVLFSKMAIICKKNCIIDIRKAFVKCDSVRINGGGNRIEVGNNCRLKNCSITIIGNDNKIIIKENCRLNNVILWIEDDHGKIYIDEETTMEGGSIAVSEGTEITIGNDCMLSYGIDIRSGDSHGIYNMQGHRINKGKNILIGTHVWIGAGVTVLKGSVIPSGCVIGHSSLVSSVLSQSNSVYAGIPAALKKSCIEWSRSK